MDEHASKSLNVGASVVIALVIIGIVFTIVTVANRMTSGGISKASGLAGQMQESTYTQYDGELIRGDQVLAILKQFQDDDIAIFVNTGGSNDTKYIYPSATFNVSSDEASCTLSGDKMTSQEFATAMRDAQDTTKSTFIAPTRKYLCVVCRNPDTKGITGLHFTLQ